ncbi:hypothetical protein C8R45DRAFT_1093910 [Mycena sanguinolenta]|nr:hypothetical protein C8R45DRAFT_1093910 [Mycena sanguinolenta]
MPAFHLAERAGSPVSPARTTGIRTLTKLLRPTRVRRVATQPASFSIPGANIETRSPSSSPSLYSLSSDSDSRSNLLSASDRPLLSPTSSIMSSSTSEGHGIDSTVKHRNDYSASDLDDATEPSSPGSPDDYSWAMNRAYLVRPQRIITDEDDGTMDHDDTSILKRTEPAKLQVLSPAEWLGSNGHAKAVFGSSSSSPATPRPRSVSEINRLYASSDLDVPRRRSHTTTGLSDSELTETWRRPRSASEPRSFLGSAKWHAGPVSSTPTEYILTIPPELDTGPNSAQTILPPPRQSSLPSPITMPDDVYFTAAGRRESRMYIRPDGPSYVPASPMRRGHAHSNSVPLLPPADADQRPLARYASWTGKKREPTSGRPFEDLVRAVTPPDGDHTPIPSDWSGNWNRDDIQDVIRQLRLLK